MRTEGTALKLLYALFFLSGAAGLAYEIVWSRQMALLFGVSVYAVAAVLAAFMAGLGIGAELAGRALDRGLAPIRLYAVLELALAVYVLSFPLLFSLLQQAYLYLHPGVEGVTPYVTLLRFLLAFTVLIVPTTLMGGTLPALARHVTGSDTGESGAKVGMLYAVNTFGAMAGSLAAGFALVEYFGLTGTLFVCAALNFTVAATAFAAAGEKSWFPGKKRQKTEVARRINPKLLFLFGVSGFGAFAFETFWTRLLILLLNNTVYAFAMILAVFLAGIAIGSAIGSHYAKRLAATSATSAGVFGMLQVMIGIVAVLSFYMLNIAGGITTAIGNAFGGGLGLLGPNGTPAALFTLFIVFPATILMGAGFPVVFESEVTDADRSGGVVGRMYAVNTIGCVIGSIVAGFILMPVAGVQNGAAIVAAIMIISGGWLYFSAAKNKNFAGPAIVATGLFISAGLFVLPGAAKTLSAEKSGLNARIDYFQEGPSSAVLVSSQPSDLSIGRKPVKRLWINGDPIAGGFREALQLERLQAHIPLLLKPDASSGLVICFGTGSTAGAVASHGLKDITVVDISPEVFGAAKYFTDVNNGIAENKNVKFVLEDGRNFLLTTKRRFDFITSEPPPPSNAGVVNLYTREYYRLALSRLTDTGIMSHWIPLHHLSPDDFRSLVAAFFAEFPYAQMWYTKWDAIMIGAKKPFAVDTGVMARGMENPAVAASLAEIGVTDAIQLFGDFMMDRPALEKYVSGAQIPVDDSPFIEFSAPRAVRDGTMLKGVNLAKLIEFRSPPDDVAALPEQVPLLPVSFQSATYFLVGQAEESFGRKREAAGYYSKALEIYDGNNNARYAYLLMNLETMMGSLSPSNSDPGRAMLEYTEKLDTASWFISQWNFLRGMYATFGGEHRKAEEAFAKALEKDENYFMVMVNLAGLYAGELRQPEKAKELYEKALGLDISNEERNAVQSAMKNL